MQESRQVATEVIFTNAVHHELWSVFLHGNESNEVS